MPRFPVRLPHPGSIPHRHGAKETPKILYWRLRKPKEECEETGTVLRKFAQRDNWGPWWVHARWLIDQANRAAKVTASLEE
jgi:hypothetical protein